MTFERMSDSADKRAIIMTIAGEAGVGKTSLGAIMPNPIILRVEDGVESVRELNPFVTRVCETSQQVAQELAKIDKGEHDFKTVVVDSVSELTSMFSAEICAQSGVESIALANGGYGAGLSALENRTRKFRDYCGQVSKRRGLHMVFLCHAEHEDFAPEDADPYTRLGLKLHKRCRQAFVDNVDLVGFVRIRKAVSKSSKGSTHTIAKSGGSRELVCNSVPSVIAKNRFGITEALDFPVGTNPLLPYLGD